MGEIVLIIVSHSDDESISMAGTICKHVNKGDKVYVMSMTDGVSSRDEIIKDSIKKRREASIKASKILGFEWGECFNFGDNLMDKYPLLDVVKAIEINKQNYKPSIVYTHSISDLNIDHRVVANAALTAFRPQPMEICREIRLFEIASATDYGNSAITGSFSPNLFVDISDHWDSKKEALIAYCDEMRDYPHSRSIEGIKNLAKIRGNQVGLYLAEAFQVIRKLEI